MSQHLMSVFNGVELDDRASKHSMTHPLGVFHTFLAVASSVVGITVVQVRFPTPTLNISWNIPQDGATVTGYTIDYSRNGTGKSIDVQHGTTLLISNLVADGQPYNITIETHSIHLSAFSVPLRYELCKFLVYVMAIAIQLRQELHSNSIRLLKI